MGYSPWGLKQSLLKKGELFVGFFLAMPHSFQDLSSPPGIKPCAPRSGSAESSPLDPQVSHRGELKQTSMESEKDFLH